MTVKTLAAVWTVIVFFVETGISLPPMQTALLFIRNLRVHIIVINIKPL